MITADTLKKWGCRDWSDDERQALADIANCLGLVESTTGSWPELAAAYREYLA